MLAIVPIVWMFSAVGSSSDALICATSMICLPDSIACSSARIDLRRPTNSGITMCGNTTTSRSGRTGSTISEPATVLGGTVSDLSWVIWGLRRSEGRVRRSYPSLGPKQHHFNVVPGITRASWAWARRKSSKIAAIPRCTPRVPRGNAQCVARRPAPRDRLDSQRAADFRISPHKQETPPPAGFHGLSLTGCPRPRG